MKGNTRTCDHRQRFVETLAAELAETAYVVALQHDRTASWIDLELELWRALQNMVQQRLPAMPPDESADDEWHYVRAGSY